MTTVTGIEKVSPKVDGYTNPTLIKKEIIFAICILAGQIVSPFIHISTSFGLHQAGFAFSYKSLGMQNLLDAGQMQVRRWLAAGQIHMVMNSE